MYEIMETGWRAFWIFDGGGRRGRGGGEGKWEGLMVLGSSGVGLWARVVLLIGSPINGVREWELGLGFVGLRVKSNVV